MASLFKKFAVPTLIGVATASYQSTVVMCQEERPFEIVPPVLHPQLVTKTSAGVVTPVVDEEFQPKTWGIKWDNDWDGRRHKVHHQAVADAAAPADGGAVAAAPPPPHTAAVRQFLMVRHGQYCNESNKDATDADKSLSALGRQQAAATGKFLREALQGRVGDQIFVGSKIDRVHVSELSRAKQTAAILLNAYCEGDTEAAAKLVAQPDPLLNERYPCDPEPPYPKRAKVYHMKLVEEGFRKYIHRPDDDTQHTPATVELMVGHGNIIRYFTCRALQLPPEAWLRLSIPHCSVTNLVMRRNGTVKLVAFGSFSHMAPQLQTLMNVPYGEALPEPPAESTAPLTPAPASA